MQRHFHWIGRSTALACMGAVLLVFGCGKQVQPPHGTLSKAEMTTQQAAENNAKDHAPLELKLAQEKLEKARVAMLEERFEEARRWSEQALADAELAKAKASTDELIETVAEVEKSIQALQDEAYKNSEE